MSQEKEEHGIPRAKTDGLGNPIVDSDSYYIQDIRQLVGNCILWWGKFRSGYTCNLHEAGVYNGHAAKGMRDTDVPWPEEYVRDNTVLHVRGDAHAFDRSKYKPENA